MAEYERLSTFSKPHFSPMIVSITLIATGFKRQEESEGRTLQASQLGQGDVTLGTSRRPSFMEGGSVEIPEFLRKKGRLRYPRA
ncbi:unnamed protein product [Ilex paraguariensis]|uniref:Uncharacterized protein n=1 Tax=Ilex paraguariensis TaxID=185542 RepID=A0ABC8V4K8_9AQUA